MMPQTGKKIIAIHILSNISKSKGNQRMKFGQLIEYSMENIFLENSNTNCRENLVPDTFTKNSNLNTSLDQQYEISKVYFS